MAIPTLQYHRRHENCCVGEHEYHTYSNEYDERKKGWKRAIALSPCPYAAALPQLQTINASNQTFNG